MTPTLRTLTRLALAAAALFVAAGPLRAIQQPPVQNPKVKHRAKPLDANQARTPAALRSLAAGAVQRKNALDVADAWNDAAAALGPRAIVQLDPRTGGPLSVQPDGLPWLPGNGVNNRLTAADMARWGGGSALAGQDRDSVDDAVLERIARDFMTRHPRWFPVPQSQLRLEPRGPLTDRGAHARTVLFRQVVDGIEVEDAMLLFNISHGNLVSFGGQSLATVRASAAPVLDESAARAAALAYAGLDEKSLAGKPTAALRFVIVDDGAQGPGAGYAHRLIWAVTLATPNHGPTWRAEVDARNGDILAFEDENRYGTIVGGVYPISNDGICPSGCEQGGFPMPFADTGLVAPDNFTDTGGNYNAASGTVTTTLTGRLTRISDNCGAISASVTAPANLDLSGSAGTDCAVPSPNPGGAGNTHSSRTAFYNVTKTKEEVIGWISGGFNNTLLNWMNTYNVPVNVNINQTCNAFWTGAATGSLNMYRDAASTCRNTGEIAMIFDHELGHGIDVNDGTGGLANPGEAYADDTAFLHHHDACIGRGFFKTGVCSGYGDACVTCSGVRGQDWTAHVGQGTTGSPNPYPHTVLDLQSGNNTAPNTPMQCPAGGDVCGFETHCAAYPVSEAVWDAATIDLPHNAIPTNGGSCVGNGAPLTQSQAWNLMSKIFWRSVGSLGGQYTCATDGTAGCGATTLFHLVKVQDDDDGNLTNGTPHASELQCGFGRHQVGCSTDNNTSSSSCPAIGTPVVTASIGNNQAVLNWTAAANAASYRVFRNEEGCGAGYTLIGTVTAPTATYTDSGLQNGRNYYYQVQAIGSNGACEGAPSACATVTPQPCAGVIVFNKPAYRCTDSMSIQLTDADLSGTGTHNITVRSTTEAAPETVVLTEAGSSGIFNGSFPTVSAPAAGGDGQLSVNHGDTITAAYLDVSYCGTPNVTVERTAAADCVAPVISAVAATAITDSGATITWTTDEAANSRVTHGTSAPPGTNTDDLTNYVVSHSVPVSGLTGCTNYVFSVTSADPPGNSVSANNGGAYYPFTTAGRSFAFGPENVEGAPLLTPTGTAGTIWHSDTCKANSATHAWKAGAAQGTCPGTYGNTADTYLTSAAIALGAPGHGYHLRFWEFLDSEPGYDFAHPQISTNGGSSWVDLVTTYSGSSGGWRQRDFDLAAYSGSVMIRFWFHTDGSVVAEGWYVDDIDISKTQVCTPDLHTQNAAAAADTCTSGGAGNGNSVLDAGERFNLTVTSNNAGAQAATGVSGTLSSLSSGVTVTTPTAAFPDIPANGTGASSTPYAVQLDPALACGTVINFRMDYATAQGAYYDTFSKTVGSVISGNGTALTEPFANPIPASWTIVDGGTGGGGAATWTGANPGARTTLTAPFSAPFAIVDSDNAGTGATQDEQLISPVLNLSTATAVTLDFDNQFRWYSGGGTEIGDVDVRSSATSGAWVNVLRIQGASDGYPTPNHKTVVITTQAAGAADAQVRFRYSGGAFDWWWAIDNVVVTYVAPGGCNQTGCTLCAATPMSVLGQGKNATNLVQTWGAVGGATNYSVYRADSANPGNWGPAVTTLGAALTWTDAGQLSNGTSRFYTVTDFNACGAESAK